MKKQTVMPTQIFQVAYDQGLLRVREVVLTEHGFSVRSALGNTDARHVLAENAPYDAFLIGWSATSSERKSIVSWLKQRWPTIPVIALHDPYQEPTPGADFTATYDTPAGWISTVKTVLQRKQ
jgi:DNA-binding NtrC family response regulator